MEKVKILWLINYSCRSNNIFRSLYRFLAIQLQTTYRRCISYEPFKHFTPKHQYASSPYCSLYISLSAFTEIVSKKSRASWVCNHFHFSYDFHVWFRGDTLGEIRFQGLRSALAIIIIIVDVLLVNACHNISPLFSVHREIAQRHPGNRKTVYYRTPCNKRLVSDLIKTFFVSRIKVEISLTAELVQIVLNSPQWIDYFFILLSRFP